MTDMTVSDKVPERHPIQKMTLNSDKIKGLEDFSVDEEVEVVLKLKVLKPMGRQVWDKEDMKKPLEGEYEILSGKAVSVQSKIDEADTLEDLDKASGFKRS